ncbi:alpha/beta fold hydrolase [Microvirga pakistanensis]|uniref:alpha/beta fold hydrolase n=1 Tax=Microvirga pakistanensis TaxID=1682650 RepID=UPI00106C7D96|nr:alpha/beta fold hydrolase [Microvirga pakistanensis]
MDYDIYSLGAVTLQNGTTLEDCRLAYKTYGNLSRKRDNAIVFPTWFAGDHTHNEWLIGAGKALDPDRYFIIVPNLLGNGLSSSPSNTLAPQNADRFPNVTVYDNVRLQYRLVTERFGIEQLALVVGSSMGAMQSYHWAALFPHMVQRLAPFCGSARCARHTQVFIEGIRAALTADSAWNEGQYDTPPIRGLRAMARVYAGWGFSQAFFREELDRKCLNFLSIEEYITGFWERAFLPLDANNLLAMMWTWQNADISANPLYDGDFDRALRAITAKAVVMPSRTDLYFPPEDSEHEVASMPNARLAIIPSIWGHFAGGLGRNQDDVTFIDHQIKQLLSD